MTISKFVTTLLITFLLAANLHAQNNYSKRELQVLSKFDVNPEAYKTEAYIRDVNLVLQSSKRIRTTTPIGTILTCTGSIFLGFGINYAKNNDTDVKAIEGFTTMVGSLMIAGSVPIHATTIVKRHRRKKALDRLNVYSRQHKLLN